ncbi:hypothetical protein A4R44_00061 [Amycolatopsis sp. M39]|nr:hypothetical protein A4R44_00061 [Amycolatopsis sp. M39]
MPPGPNPRIPCRTPGELLLAYLGYYRAALLHELDGLAEAELRISRLPSDDIRALFRKERAASREIVGRGAA